MSNPIIPAAHYIQGATLAEPKVLNRVFNDVNAVLSKLWDGAVVLNPEVPYAILGTDNVLRPGAVNFRDATFWPESVENVSISYALLAGGGTLTPNGSGKGSYAAWTPPALTHSTFTPISVQVRMSASFDSVFLAQEEFTVVTTERTFTLQHPVYVNMGDGDDDVHCYLNGAEIAHSAVANGATTVTITPTPSAGDVVSIRYEWRVSSSKTGTASVVIYPQPNDGADAVDDPIVQFAASTTILPLSSIAGSAGASFSFIDTTLVNPGDSITSRTWRVYSGVTDVTANASYVSHSGNTSVQFSPRILTAGQFKITLSVQSTNHPTAITREIYINVVDIWNFGQVIIDNDYDNDAAPFMENNKIPMTITELSDTVNASYYNGDPLQKKLTVDVPVIMKGAGSIITVTDIGDSQFELFINQDVFNTYNINPASLRSGIDYFYYQDNMYLIDSISVVTGVSCTITIDNTLGMPDPDSNWENTDTWGIGVLADSWVVKLEQRITTGGDPVRIYWAEIFKPAVNFGSGTWQQGLYEYSAKFINVLFGGYLQAYVYARHGNVLSAAGITTEVLQSPNGGAATVTAISNVNKGTSATKIRWTGSNAQEYEVFFKDEPNVTSYTVHADEPPVADGSNWKVYLAVGESDPSDVLESGMVWHDGFPYVPISVTQEDVGSLVYVITLQPLSTNSPNPSSAWLSTEILNFEAGQESIAVYGSTSIMMQKTRQSVIMLPTDFTISNNYQVLVRGIDIYGRIGATVKRYLI